MPFDSLQSSRNENLVGRAEDTANTFYIDGGGPVSDGWPFLLLYDSSLLFQMDVTLVFFLVCSGRNASSSMEIASIDRIFLLDGV